MFDVSALRPLALLLPLVVTALAPAAGWAQDGSICALLADDRKRLDCYDLLFKKPQAEKSKPTQPAKIKTATGTGRWDVASQLSKLDDSTNLFVSVDSLEPYDDGYESNHATLTIACREGKTNLWIHFKTTMDGGTIIYRVDKDPAAKLAVEHDSSYEALGLWTPEEAIPFSRKLLNADHLLVRAIPTGESAEDFEFPITGLAEAIKPLRKACNW